MVECTYCGEEDKYKAIIQKPTYFIHDKMKHQMVNISKEEVDLICLECLEYEIEELKECY